MQKSLFSLRPALTVSQVNRYIQEVMAADEILQNITVRGEISNFVRASSGHMYLSLKDGQSVLRAVIWKGTALRLRFIPRNGQIVDARGSIGVYERDGTYQLYINELAPLGEGDLYQEFLRLKARLEEKGLFDPARKRPLPLYPRRIGVVTSPTGAALQDILNTLRRRYPGVEVLLSPAAVQGAGAPAELVQALQRLYRLQPPPDVILLARGGGSLEDLWAFNDEALTECVAASPVPLISGVGHETDFTLVDFAADLRAPTPTGAAEQAVPDREELRGLLQSLAYTLDTHVKQTLRSKAHELAFLSTRLESRSPQQQVNNARQRSDLALQRLQQTVRYNLFSRRAEMRSQAARLEALNPAAILIRGYAALSHPDGSRIISVNQVNKGDPLRVWLADGGFEAQAGEVWKTKDK